ncbi:hypothetical protein [Massilia varians]|uniref:hypothetical protein n=1 Tax=Massilia varians TaxID=457921 RepID=UPI0025576E4E|nr:hypothetical protein [Massilia varians]MDK6078346.1 hypothetical protein [Massilia varians]
MSSDNEQQSDEVTTLRGELTQDTIAARMKLILLAETPEKRRFPTLEEQTGVPENTWRTWWKRGGTPSGSMVEAVARTWPQYAFWLATGLTDAVFGHRMPQPIDIVKGYVRPWPEGHLKHDRLYAQQYFKICKEMQDLYRETGGRTGEKGEILENSRLFVQQKRHEEAAQPIAFDKWTGNEI